jgi:hypothetical protein
VIGTGCIGSYKSNYHAITTAAPRNTTLCWIFYFWCFNATFSNISAISWRPVLELEEPERTTDHWQATGKLYHLRLRVECTFFVIYKAMNRKIWKVHSKLTTNLNTIVSDCLYETKLTVMTHSSIPNTAGWCRSLFVSFLFIRIFVVRYFSLILFLFCILLVLFCLFPLLGSSWSCGSWIYDYLLICYQCLSPLIMWVRIPLMVGWTRYNFMWYSL